MGRGDGAVRPAPILDPRFVWIPAATHGDSTAFRERQQERMKKAERERASVQSVNVKQMPTKKRDRAAEADSAAIRG